MLLLPTSDAQTSIVLEYSHQALVLHVWRANFKRRKFGAQRRQLTPTHGYPHHKPSPICISHLNRCTPTPRKTLKPPLMKVIQWMELRAPWKTSRFIGTIHDTHANVPG
ncbi:hypothetical protein PILCRDRAFT_606021 [Piloderma croceum F 1598]|uniref:Uncharacterized protein n=1 Tax=Piloderma croceum (strain F 1598) TaxID=765440 RepID=A0A0C3FDQ0_PILCF|nr:hypothetical protein PILCRDRAFT_606021 [Piloderma croceum F 1598]